MQVHLTELLQRRFPSSRAALQTVASQVRADVVDQDVSKDFWSRVEVPKPDFVAWEDTEIDVRRVVL